jgi:GT2 family glycosyltransferase
LITIIVPNYNGEAHLKTLIPSLKKQTYKDYKLVLVDNGSDDGSAEYIKKRVPGSVILKMDKNYGFARAVNEGINFTLSTKDSEYILLLNNDIELKAGFLKKGLNAFKEEPDASIVAVKMMNYFKRDIIDDCGDFPKANGGSPVPRGHDEKDTGQYDTPEYVFGACAGAAFYKTEVFEKAGLFDEDFFAYYEDIDFSFRAQFAGIKCFYQPGAVCYHKRGGTGTKSDYGFQTEYCERNLVLMRFKNYPLSIYLLNQPLFFIARIRRYWFFFRHVSPMVFLKALKGYFRGISLLPFQISKRRKIQSSRKVTVEYIKSLFIK